MKRARQMKPGCEQLTIAARGDPSLAGRTGREGLWVGRSSEWLIHWIPGSDPGRRPSSVSRRQISLAVADWRRKMRKGTKRNGRRAGGSRARCTVASYCIGAFRTEEALEQLESGLDDVSARSAMPVIPSRIPSRRSEGDQKAYPPPLGLSRFMANQATLM